MQMRRRRAIAATSFFELGSFNGWRDSVARAAFAGFAASRFPVGIAPA